MVFCPSIAYRGEMARAKLPEGDIRTMLADIPMWTRIGDAIERTWTFDTYPEAIAFLVRVAFLAEGMSHHPDITNAWTRVKLSLTTHDAGGLTERDFKLATKIDAL